MASEKLTRTEVPMKRLILALTSVGALFVLMAPASATVHEIVGQWCSGHDPLAPPGISGGSNADNFAQPLNAMGIVIVVPGFDPDGAGPQPPGLLITFDFDHPATKITPTGTYVALPGGLYLAEFVPDTSEGFGNCKGLR
jgi:hypothetical protein